MYKKITNNPVERQRIFYPWCYWDNAFTMEELDKMCEYFAQEGTERGSTVGRSENGVVGQELNEDVRISNVKFHSLNENTTWIFERLNFVINEVNERFFNFNLNGYETVQYTTYDGVEEGRYDYHQDTIMGSNIPENMTEMRKLSMTMMLNEPGVDFEGGEFQMNTGKEINSETVPVTRGRMIFFPSFMIHRVAPVTKGTRKSLVTWVTGPKFI